MKTTVELPDDLLERTKIAAARRCMSMKSLVIEGLETILRKRETDNGRYAAIERPCAGLEARNSEPIKPSRVSSSTTAKRAPVTPMLQLGTHLPLDARLAQ